MAGHPGLQVHGAVERSHRRTCSQRLAKRAMMVRCAFKIPLLNSYLSLLKIVHLLSYHFHFLQLGCH